MGTGRFLRRCWSGAGKADPMSPRFSFLPPSAGDQMLSGATKCTIELHRWPAANEDADSQSSVTFEVRGELLLTGSNAAELLAALIAEFRRPASDGKEGFQC